MGTVGKVGACGVLGCTVAVEAVVKDGVVGGVGVGGRVELIV